MLAVESAWLGTNLAQFDGLPTGSEVWRVGSPVTAPTLLNSLPTTGSE